MPNVNMTELRDVYRQICACRDCPLPERFCPQLRPPGPDYKPGGAVFVQINPGQVGSLSDKKIAKYRTENARNIAIRKTTDTRRLLSLQEEFTKNPNDTAYERMRAAFFTSMSELWGWPPGKYRSTIESHGLLLNEVACLNLAQCPVPDDSYWRDQLDHCWSKWTWRLLKLLRPALIVAQGKQVWDFIRERPLPCDAMLVEGLHHADRKSRETKEKILSGARHILAGTGVDRQRRTPMKLYDSHMGESRDVHKIIKEMVDLETEGWSTKNPDLFLSMIHPDMAWPWPPTADAHDPIDWVFVMGRFDRERWRKNWQDLFDSYDLVHNDRDTVKIVISQEQDAAFAVVDIDTLWRHKVTKEESHWKGRVCKIYTKLSSGEWKFYYQTGALNFPYKKSI